MNNFESNIDDLVYLLVIERSHNVTYYRICLKNRHFHISAFYQCIGERHFVSHSKRKTMKGNVLPKLPSQVDFCLEREKCKKKDLFDSVWTVYHFATYL